MKQGDLVNRVYEMAVDLKKVAIDTIKTQVFEDGGDGVYGTDLMESLVRISRRVNLDDSDDERAIIVSALEDINDSDHYDDAEYLIKKLSLNIAIQNDISDDTTGFYIQPDQLESDEVQIKDKIKKLLTKEK